MADEKVAGSVSEEPDGTPDSRDPCGTAPLPADAHIAAALRSAYEEAVREDVPAEFLDLLGKLA